METIRHAFSMIEFFRGAKPCPSKQQQVFHGLGAGMQRGCMHKLCATGLDDEGSGARLLEIFARMLPDGLRVKKDVEERLKTYIDSFSSELDGCGFTTEPDAGAWTWGLQLQCYGFVSSEREATSPAHVSAEGGRVVYEWDATLEEWYVNDTRGLEHGYTVRRRPPQDAPDEGSPLTITLAVRDDLRPEVTADGPSRVPSDR